jgi:hypothetical protein
MPSRPLPISGKDADVLLTEVEETLPILHQAGRRPCKKQNGPG